MKNNLKGILIAGLLSLVFITSCDNINGSLPEDFDRSGEELRITVIFYPTTAAISEAYREKFGKDKADRIGFASWTNPAGKRPYQCTVHVQKSLKDGDRRMKTLGHEMTHCLLGTWHPEP